MSEKLFHHKANLTEIVTELHRQRRGASALKYILRFLDYDPENKEALDLANIICDGGHDQYEEHLTKNLLLDQRIDSIFNECSVCLKSWIPAGSGSKNLGGRTWSLSSYGFGGYCPHCKEAFCSEHVLSPMPESRVGKFFEQCPKCYGKLELEAYGRKKYRHQPPRKNLMLNQVLFVREGPIPPSKNLAKQVLRLACLDVFEDCPTVIGLNLVSWIEDVEYALDAIIDWREINQLTCPNDQSIHIWAFKVVETQANAFIIKIWSDVPRVTSDNILEETKFAEDFEYRRFMLE